MVRLVRLVGLLMLALFLVSSGCTTKSLKVKSSKSSSAQFSSYASFAIGKEDTAPKSYATTPMANDVRQDVESFVVREMTQKGYAQSGETADLVVRVGSGVRMVKDTTAAHGTPAAMPGGNELDVEHDQTQGSIRVDVYDAKTNAVVYTGTVGTIEAAKEEDRARMSDAIHRMFVDFPAR
jgi:hypothetical protein